MASITDDDWADLVAHELPKTSDAVVQKYFESRRALVAEEQKHRSDSSFRNALSPIARRACDILSKIRDEERAAGSPVMPKESTRSWRIIRQLPKGALLRTHCHSLVDLDHLLEVALATPGMHISCPDGPLATEASRRDGGLCIRFREKADGSEGCSLWAQDYQPGAFVPFAKAADDYPDGGREGLKKWLKGRFRTERSGGGSGALCDIIYYEPVWRAFLQRMMTNLVEDGVRWLELRLTFRLVYYREGLETPDQDYDHMFQVIGEEVARFQAARPAPPFWGLRIVWSTMRDQDPRSIIEDADECIATKLAWPHLVTGYDLAGSERLGRPLADLVPELFWFRKQCALEGITIPFFLRAAEGDGGRGNLFDALLLGSRRIGNPLSLCNHPRLVDAVRDKRVLVEFGAAAAAGSSIRNHALSALLMQGVSCALCDDDSGDLIEPEHGVGSRMTNVFWQTLQAWDDVSLDLATLGSLAENSVRWAAFEDQDSEMWARDIRAASVGGGVKATRLRQWAVEWEHFCLWVVAEYGDAYGDEEQP